MGQHLPKIELEMRGVRSRAPTVVRTEWQGLSCEHVRLTSPADFEYTWAGETNYLALHHLQLVDGLAFLENREPGKLLDLRKRMTFAPRGAKIEGWSSLAGRDSCYTALFFKADFLKIELGSKAPTTPTRPALYFEDQALLASMEKLRRALAPPEPVDQIYAETVALLCVLELARSNRLVDYRDAKGVGRLSLKDEAMVRDYIEGNLVHGITLDELASLVGLSRFHFLRSFKQTIGTTPHQFINLRRVTRATEMLAFSKLSLGAIAVAAAFTSQQQFTTAFRRATGIAPGQFRRRLK